MNSNQGDLPAAPGKGCGAVRESRRTRWRLLSWGIVHVLILVHVAHWKLSGKTLSPLEPSESMQTLELGYLNAGFLLFAASIVLTAILGRFFCGWACHLIPYQDLCGWLMKKLGVRPRPFRSRFLVFVPVGAAFYMFAWPALSRFLAGHGAPAWIAHLSTDDFWATFPGLWMSILSVLLCGPTIVYLLGNKGFCTYGCPYGVFFAGASRVAPGQILVGPNCDSCGHCTVACTSNVRVHEEIRQFGRVVSTGCMKTLDCVDVCPNKALRFGFSRPQPSKHGPRPIRRYDFSLGEEVGLGILLLCLLWVFRGLYDVVSFLLALTIALLGAYTVFSAARLLWIREARLQNLVLRHNGRSTRAGVWFQALAAVFLAFSIHSAVVQLHAWGARRHLARAGAATDPSLVQAEAVAAAADYRFCLRTGLVDVAGWRLGLGSVLSAAGDDDAAERELLRAVELDPKLARAHVSLADLDGRRGDYVAAIEHLRQAAIVDPGLALLSYASAVLSFGSVREAEEALPLVESWSRGQQGDPGAAAVLAALRERLRR